MSTLLIQIQNGFKAKIRGSFGIQNVLLKTESMSTLSIQIQNGFKAKIRGSPGIQNVLLKTESMLTLSIQGGFSRKSSILDERNLSEYVDPVFNTVNTRWF